MEVRRLIHRNTFDGPGKLGRMQDALRIERAALRDMPAGSMSRNNTERNIENLEEWIQYEETWTKARADQEQKRVAAAEAAKQQHIAEEEAKLKEQQRTDFMVSNPNATDADFARVWPRLRDDHMVSRMGKALDQARASGRYSV